MLTPYHRVVKWLKREELGENIIVLGRGIPEFVPSESVSE
jgi:hypothetical protein